MKLTTILLFLPIFCFSQNEADSFSTGIIFYGKDGQLVEKFTDTIQVYALYVTDTITGESKTARMFNEQKGTIRGYWGGADADIETGAALAMAVRKTYKVVKESRFWLPSGESINQDRVLIAWPVKKEK